MGFDGLEVIEFAIWLQIYMEIYGFWWLSSDWIRGLTANLRGIL